jgi:hypothetical protein
VRTGTEVESRLARGESCLIESGAEVVLTDRILQRALSEYVKDPPNEVGE